APYQCSSSNLSSSFQHRSVRTIELRVAYQRRARVVPAGLQVSPGHRVQNFSHFWRLNFRVWNARVAMSTLFSELPRAGSVYAEEDICETRETVAPHHHCCHFFVFDFSLWTTLVGNHRSQPSYRLEPGRHTGWHSQPIDHLCDVEPGSDVNANQ